jgi:hypothetical protein
MSICTILSPNAVINNSSASSDITLLVGQQAYLDFSAVTSLLLHVATADKQEYEISGTFVGNTSSTTTATVLLPNNTTLASQFLTTILDADTSTNTFTMYSPYTGGFGLFYWGVRSFTSTVLTATTGKSVYTRARAYSGYPAEQFVNTSSGWMNVASTNGAQDTTTAWTSLGTLSFPISVTGHITILRRS